MNSNDSNNVKNVIYYVNFPKKYKRKWSDFIDKRFAIIWLITFVVHFSAVLYFTSHPPYSEISSAEISKIQGQFAELILKADSKTQEKSKDHQPIKEYVSTVSEKDITADKQQSKSISEGTGTVKISDETSERRDTFLSRKNKNIFNSRKRQSSNNKISNEVSSKGLLALLGSTSTNAKGEGVQNILDDAASKQENLKEVLGNVSGLKKNGKAHPGAAGQSTNHNIKGTRLKGKDEINSLISSHEQAASSDMKRQGNFIKGRVTAIKSDKSAVTGNRDADEISVVINRHNAAIQSCYERGLKRNPDLKGKLVLRFTITADGRVKNVNLISSTLNNSRVERCIVGKIRRWDDFGQVDPALGDAIIRQVYALGY